MKKILLSTALVVATAGVAAAEVKISGSGRFGLVYNGAATGIVNSTRVENRLRFNIDASVETESGVTFGGRIRLQDNNNGGGRLSPSQVFAKYNGMTLQVGNVDTAYDSVALMYDSEVGYIGSSFGNPGGDYFSFSSGPYSSVRSGIFFSYAIEGINLRFSYVDPDQVIDPVANSLTDEKEIGISADYTTGQFTVSAAANKDGGGLDGNDQFFLGAAYKFSDAGTVGLNYIDNGDNTPGVNTTDNGRTIVLYGNYTFGATTLRAYVANNDGNNAGEGDFPGNNSTAFGIGADYDLGGATLAAGIQRGYDEETVADLGVKFSF